MERENWMMEPGLLPSEVKSAGSALVPTYRRNFARLRAKGTDGSGRRRFRYSRGLSRRSDA